MKRLLLAALAFPLIATAQEVVTIPTRPGVTQSFFIAGMGPHKAEAIALLYVGGGGNIRLRMEEGKPKFGDKNFLPRSRREFIRNGILPVVMDAPSDQQSPEMSDDYRWSEEQTADARAVLAELKRRYAGLPIYILSTSRSSLTAASLGGALREGEVAGIMLSSSMFSPPRRSPRATISAFDFGSIKVPVLVVHHREDSCQFTPYQGAARLGERYPLISVKGGKPPESGPCDPFAAHGYFGKEAQTVDAIAGWMLKKPFAREIE
jgi:pimeloyl-ACP methyl ester carboxylesterase